MSDIVEKLRASKCGNKNCVADEGAAEITTLRAEVERLRAALREIADLKSYSEVSTAIKVAAIARAALTQEKQ